MSSPLLPSHFHTSFYRSEWVGLTGRRRGGDARSRASLHIIGNTVEAEREEPRALYLTLRSAGRMSQGINVQACVDGCCSGQT
jgi:hypothetical protein